jgi:8-oxo-dGTP diphosphatase
MNTNGKAKLPKDYDVTKFDKPSVTVDTLIFTIDNDELKIVLVKRTADPFKDRWAIPGGFVQMQENLEQAAIRKLVDETGITDVYLEQLYTFGDPKRDPRTRVITVAYMALAPFRSVTYRKGQEISEVKWFSVGKLPPMAFDHKQIVLYALKRLQKKIDSSLLAFGLLPKEFRLSELQKVHEVILGEPIDKRNFRKKILSLDLIEPTGNKDLEGAHRPAMLYHLKNRKELFSGKYL